MVRHRLHRRHGIHHGHVRHWLRSQRFLPPPLPPPRPAPPLLPRLPLRNRHPPRAVRRRGHLHPHGDHHLRLPRPLHVQLPLSLGPHPRPPRLPRMHPQPRRDGAPPHLPSQRSGGLPPPPRRPNRPPRRRRRLPRGATPAAGHRPQDPGGAVLLGTEGRHVLCSGREHTLLRRCHRTGVPVQARAQGHDLLRHLRHHLSLRGVHLPPPAAARVRRKRKGGETGRGRGGGEGAPVNGGGIEGERGAGPAKGEVAGHRSPANACGNGVFPLPANLHRVRERWRPFLLLREHFVPGFGKRIACRCTGTAYGVGWYALCGQVRFLLSGLLHV
mmetsp:Transcript_13287/g.29283  ORF Transcript_13287/g.29283 Transcript_13287/m.29283 type:complete len:329 (+) Transcript_13287:1059-2045(+)